MVFELEGKAVDFVCTMFGSSKVSSFLMVNGLGVKLRRAIVIVSIEDIDFSPKSRRVESIDSKMWYELCNIFGTSVYLDGGFKVGDDSPR